MENKKSFMRRVAHSEGSDIIISNVILSDLQIFLYGWL
jgi:hypothetical protein